MYLSISGPRKWVFPSEYAALDGKRISRQGNTEAADTETSGIFLETSIVKELYRKLNDHFDKAQQGYVFPANTTKFRSFTLPDNVTLQPADFSLGSTGPGILLGSIQDKGNLKFDGFGTPWFNNVYAVFDFGVTGPGVTRFEMIVRTTTDN